MIHQIFFALLAVTQAFLFNQGFVIAAQSKLLATGGDTIYIIRHSEKPTDTEFGVDYDGTADGNSLIVMGWQRAGALNSFFDTVLSRPNHIYACLPVKTSSSIGTNSRRMQETVMPIAAKLNVYLNMTYTKGQEKQLAAELGTLSGITLISWQHDEIPVLANYLKLASGTKIPTQWDSTRYDIVWRFIRSDVSTPWSFDQIPQMLLVGDQNTIMV